MVQHVALCFALRQFKIPVLDGWMAATEKYTQIFLICSAKEDDRFISNSVFLYLYVPLCVSLQFSKPVILKLQQTTESPGGLVEKQIPGPLPQSA